MSALEPTIYKTQATAEGGRAGRVRSADGTLDVDLVVPEVIFGALPPQMQEVPPPSDRPRVDPEKLFAAGYAGCFLSALRFVALQQEIDASGASVSVSVALKPGSGGAAFVLGVAIEVALPGIPVEDAERVVAAAHRICPYSAAVKGNIDVDVSLAS